MTAASYHLSLFDSAARDYVRWKDDVRGEQ